MSHQTVIEAEIRRLAHTLANMLSKGMLEEAQRVLYLVTSSEKMATRCVVAVLRENIPPRVHIHPDRFLDIMRSIGVVGFDVKCIKPGWIIGQLGAEEASHTYHTLFNNVEHVV